MLNRANRALIAAQEKGYTLGRDGVEVHSKRGKMNLRLNFNGYYTFYVQLDGRSAPVPVHRYQAFRKFGQALFEKGILVRHLNGDPLDNSWDNIAIGTHTDNQNDIPADQRSARSIKASRHTRKFNDEQVKEILRDRANGYSYTALMRKYGGCKTLYGYMFKRSAYGKQKEVASAL